MKPPKTNDTVCKECIFAEWEGDTQVGCRVGKLQDYRDQKIPVIKCYDAEKEFYVIPGRRCMYMRTEDWKHKHQPWGYQKRKIDNEIELQFQAIVVAGLGDDDEGLRATLDSLYEQELKPYHIAVVRPPLCHLHPRKVLNYFAEKSGILWKIENVLDIEYPVEKYEDLIVDFVKNTNMYSRFNAGTVVPPDFFSTINYRVHEEMFAFSALMPNSEGSGWTIPRSIYVYFMGNKQLTLLTKLEGYECPTFPVTEVVPSFPL